MAYPSACPRIPVQCHGQTQFFTLRHFLLGFCGIIVCHRIGNKIRVDATLRLGHEALLEGHQGQIIFSSMFIFDRFEISSKPNIDRCFFLHLPPTTCFHVIADNR